MGRARDPKDVGDNDSLVMYIEEQHALGVQLLFLEYR